MATILPFTTRGAARSRPVSSSAQSAEIVIFPGVRYENETRSTRADRPAVSRETPKLATPETKN